MESISRFACARSSALFLHSRVNPRPSIPSRVSIGRVRSHNYNMIKPQKRQRRSKEWMRWVDLSGLDGNEEVDEDPIWEEDHEELEDPISDEELEEMEKEAIEGLDDGREPSDYDRRAQIFDESSRAFKVLKQKSENGSTGGGNCSS